MSENTISTDVVIAEAHVDPAELIRAFQNPDSLMSSTVKAETFAERKMVLKAMMDAKNIRDHQGKPFELVGWTAQVVKITDDKTGEVSDNVRIVMMGSKGEAFACVSSGIATALKNIRSVMGDPAEWDEPLKVMAKEEAGKGMNRYLTLVLA